MTLFRQWENKLKQQSTVNIQNTKDDLKILLRILSIKNFHNYFHHSYSYLWLCSLCLDTGIHNPSTDCNRLSNVSATFSSVWKSTVQPTPTKWFYIFANSRISTTWRWDTPSAKTQSPSFNLFSLLYPQTQKNEIEVSLKYGIASLYQSVLWVVAMLFSSVRTRVPTFANVTTSTWRTVHTFFGNITNHLSPYSYVAQFD